MVTWCERCLNDLKLFFMLGWRSNMCRKVSTPIDSISFVRMVQLARMAAGRRTIHRYLRTIDF
jgi:hypothetical protein